MRELHVLFWLLVLGALSYVVFVLLGETAAHSTEVAQISSVVQTYSGEIADRLSNLGPSAVPAISDKTLSGVKLHAPYIEALGRIGSGTALTPLMEMLQRHNPLSDYSSSWISMAIISSPKKIDSTQ